MISAVILAAGRAERMGEPKLFLPLGGKPVLQWVLDRCHGTVEPRESPIGWMPNPSTLNLDGLTISADALRALTDVDRAGWLEEAAHQGAFLATFGDRLPAALRKEHEELLKRLE